MDVAADTGGMEETCEMYDSARAKVAANLHWLFVKAFGPDDIPADLQDPFYTDQYEQEHIKPPVIHVLLSAELYCRVADVPHHEPHSSLQHHQSVLQLLSRKGIYVLEDNETLVSELDLSSAPIKMSCHIQLIDALITAYTEQMISIEKVMSSVTCFVEPSDSLLSPLDLEDAMVLWINKVVMKLRGSTQKEPKLKHLLDSPCNQKCPSKWYWKLLPVRYRKDQLSGRSQQHFPVLDNLSSFVSIATSLLVVVHFYCPELIRLEDICLREVPSTAESLSNIQLLLEFSNEFLNKCFYLSPEDILCSAAVLKINIMQIIAEMFWIFEVVKPDFVQPRQDVVENKDVRKAQSSNSLKQRFWSSNSMAKSTGPQRCLKGSNSAVLPLSQKEHRLIEDHTLGQRHRSSSLGQSTTNFAWPKKRQRPLSQTVPYALHFPMKENADTFSLDRSMSKDSLATNYMSTTPIDVAGPGPPRRLSGQNLANYIRYEDEEEEIEEEELVSIINPTTLSRHHYRSGTEQQDSLSLSHSLHPFRPINKHSSFGLDRCLASTEPSMEKYYLEPLMPAIPKPAKEKSVQENKREESGESKGAVRKTFASGASCGAIAGFSLRSAAHGSSDANSRSKTKQSDKLFLHLKADRPLTSLEADKDSDNEYFTEEDELNEPESQSCYRKEYRHFGEGESMKLGEDQQDCEWDDKEDHSGSSSPCLSSASWSSSGAGVKMTSFMEKKLLKLGHYGDLSSSSSTPRTTPDDSEAALYLPWQMKKSGSSYSLGKETSSGFRNKVSVPLTPGSIVPPELLELHMQLEERRHAIESQKKKMETHSAQQRLKLGKAAFLNIVKKEPGRSDTLPLPIKQGSSERGASSQRGLKAQNCLDDSCLEVLKMKEKLNVCAQLIKTTEVSQDSGHCSRSIEVLNEAIASIQQQIKELSLQQDILIKHRSVLPHDPQSDVNTTQNATAKENPPSVTPQEDPPFTESKAFVVNFVNDDDRSFGSLRCPPKLSSGQRRKSSFKKQMKNTGTEKREAVVSKMQPNVTNSFSICDDAPKHQDTFESTLQTSANSKNSAAREDRNRPSDVQSLSSEEDEAVADNRTKTHLIEVDLSEIREQTDQNSADGETEQKNALGFFFKDEEKTDEMAKRRAAFLIKQQRKAEEAKLRKLQQEAESELKRDETRRKAEEDRIRKEEEKARREFIKQEYLRRKQQMLMEEQGLVKSLPRIRPQKNRHRSLRKGSTGLCKQVTTSDRSGSHHGSTQSLVTEAESVLSMDSQRADSVCSGDSFPVVSRASSRNMERDWELGSIASSVTSTEYTGPKLFKEPSSKSNKPIIINAIAHCCLAGKVNETQKNVILEELDKCESNHLIILFRDGGCQFRAIYVYSPETEEILKLTGTGPRSISHKMIEKLYKYSSDRKQFSIIPAKSVSASVDALTIHNQLWHAKRPGSARRK